MTGVLEETLMHGTPLLLAASGGLLSERSGVINFALEGQMLAGAFAGAAVAHVTGSPWAGLAAAALAAALLGLLHAFASITVRMNQIVSSFVINILAFGLTGTLLERLFVSAKTPQASKIPHFVLAGMEISWMTPLAVALAVVLWVFFARTVRGLRVSACGENVEAARAAGLRVERIRYGSVTVGGALAGMGGAFLSLAVLGEFSTEHIIHGRGFLAVAAVIFARWNPSLLAPAVLVFAGAEALGAALQVFHAPAWLAAALPGVDAGELVSLPGHLLPMIPYVLVLVALALFATSARAPSALGQTAD